MAWKHAVSWRPLPPGAAAALASATAVLLAAAPLHAQSLQQKFEIAPEAGIVIPAGRLADLSDVGPNGGVHVGYRVVPRVIVDVDGNFNLLNGKRLASGRESPDMRLWNVTAGAEFDLMPRTMRRWDVVLDLGAGAAIFDSDNFRPTTTAAETDFQKTYFTAAGGLQVGYQVAPSIQVFVDGQTYWAAMKKEDTQGLAALDPTRIRTFSSGVTFPVSLGLRARI